MARRPAIGKQDFSSVIEENCFYVDKTYFIKDWWETGDDVTLITRPRRFGKTLTLSMVEQFFSVDYAGRGDLFEGLSIWKDEEYRKMQGTYPVISLNFSRIKRDSFKEAYQAVCKLFVRTYRKYAKLLDDACFLQSDRGQFFAVLNGSTEFSDIGQALGFLSELLYRYYGKKAILLIDEYDTPMQESYVHGYWDEMSKLLHVLFDDALKSNPYLKRALLTGITWVSKESIFSGLNHLRVVSVTVERYETAFGFTENEVFSALREYGLEQEKERVKFWYDGFRFGRCSSIYNPWSIVCFLADRKLRPYWANTSSNDIISVLVRGGSKTIKTAVEDLLQGKSFRTEIDEHVVFGQLENDETAVWSLFLSSGYLKTVDSDGDGYELALTNHEIAVTFRNMVHGWFSKGGNYNEFIKSLLKGDLEGMNYYMNTVAQNMISSFDSGTKPSGTEPERFYHGLVLGLIVELEGRYVVTSNRESGLGRYDAMLEPAEPGDDGIILEFKVQNTEKEQDLHDTAKAALQQILDKKYAAELEKRVPRDRIRMYGFAFAGKKVLIDGGFAGEYVCCKKYQK